MGRGKVYASNSPKFFKLSNLLLVGVLGVASGGATALPSIPIDALLTTSFGGYLSAEAPRSSLVFEPELIAELGKSDALTLYAAVERPTDPYKNFAVPKVTLTYLHTLPTTWGLQPALRIAVSALAVDRWRVDGHLGRALLATEFGKAFTPEFQAWIQVGTFAYSSHYRQTASGQDQPRFGFAQRLRFEYRPGRLLVRGILLIEQRYAVVWANDYSTEESIGFQLSENFLFGLSHELISSLVDGETGAYRPIQVFNNRESRVGGFIEWKL